MALDLVLIGGGLANGLIALRLLGRRKGLRIAMVEAGERLGGNHTWSFHGSDLTAAQRAWTAPLVRHGWPAQEVRFGSDRRVLPGSYHSVASDRFDEQLRTLPGLEVLTNCRAVDVSPTAVTLVDGSTLQARAVIDGRGAVATPHLALGYQKFLGLEVILERPHGLAHPILMDGTVAQHDGFRFVYVLPFGPDRLLIEDTYYSDGGDLDARVLRSRIHDYADRAGWRIAEVVRTERGVLPIVLGGDIDAYWRTAREGVARVGMRAALFHPTTGYSLPDAVRLADAVAAMGDIAADPLAALTRNLSRRLWRRRGFYRLLNRLLFLAAAPSQRIDVMARFYRLPSGLIARFYAGRTTPADMARILVGRPPVQLARAIRAVPPRAAFEKRP